MIKTKSIIINGIARSGKDTFIKYCQDFMINQNIYNLSTIDPIKKITKDLKLTDDIHNKTDEYRTLLSDLKICLTKYNNYTYNYIINEMNKLINISPNSTNVFFIQCREPKEIQKFKNSINKSITLLITKPNLKIPNNIGDQSVLDYDYDYVINNDGDLNKLHHKAITFCNTFLVNLS